MNNYNTETITYIQPTEEDLIREEIFLLGLKEVMGYHIYFDIGSPINEQTKEVLEFNEWIKTIKFNKYNFEYLPSFISDTLSIPQIKELFKPYFKERYDEILKENKEEKKDVE